MGRQCAGGFLAIVGTAALLSLGLSCKGSDKGLAGTGRPSEIEHTTHSSAVATSPTSVLLVTIDTWRWDYIGVSGTGKVATPALDRLAREGVYEPEAETPYPLTTPAHASVLTGLLPLHHGILDVIGYNLAPGVPTLAEGFRSKGYATAAFVSSVTLDRRYGLDRGFQIYDQGNFHGVESTNLDLPERDGAETTAAALAYLAAQPSGAPQFLWVHYYDLHWPYRSRPSYEARYPGNPYAAETAFVDDEVARLVASLQADKGRTWSLVVVGDHGEGFFDHHEKGHGLALYRSTLHVPLIIWPKPVRPLGHARPWRLEDLDPTLREWCGLEPGHGQDGESLFSQGGRGRILPSLTLVPAIRYGVNPCLGIRRGPLMYIRHGVEELYNLETDPGETRDLSRDPGSQRDLATLRAACESTFPVDKLQAAADSFAPVSGTDLEGLRGLGYIGGFVPSLRNLQRADIRKVCDDAAAFDRAKEVYRHDRQAEPMRRAYENLIAGYPGGALFNQQFGSFLIRQGDRDAAARAFLQAIRLNPKDTTSLADLGGLELLKGNVQRAKVLYEAVLALDPNDPVAHKNLGIIYAEYVKDPVQAVAHYRRYLELAPDSDAPLIREYIQKQSGVR